MALFGRRTFRDADGARVAGVWRPVFTRFGEVYFLSDLIIYADGVIDCGAAGLIDLDGLREELRCGRVATELEEGAQVHAHHVGDWRFAEPRAAVDAEMLIGEVVDEVDRLNGRPDSVERCQAALATYLDDPTEDNRLRLLDHYADVPPHLSRYVVDDQHSLWILMTRPGEPELGMPGGSLVTEELHAQALDELREQFRPRRPSAELAARPQTGGPEPAPLLIVQRLVYPDGWPDPCDIEVLRNDYPATLTMGGQDYPTVTHAYCALSTIDRVAHDRIVAAPCDLDAVSLAAHAPHRPGWPEARLAAMASLLRVKFLQHPELAQILLATGNARIVYNSDESGYLIGGPHRANWVGRLLELVRAELAAAEAGFLTVQLNV